MMKKMILPVLALSVVLVACSGDQANEEPVDNTVNNTTVENNVNDQNTLNDQDETQEPQADQDQALASDEDIAQAIEIAAADLNADPADLKVLMAESDGLITEVDLAFYYDGSIYKYEIKGDTIEEKEAKGVISEEEAQDLITFEEAKAAALADAGLTEDDIKDLSGDLDASPFRYEVSFEANGQEYEYEVDALTGDVVSFELDD